VAQIQPDTYADERSRFDIPGNNPTVEIGWLQNYFREDQTQASKKKNSFSRYRKLGDLSQNSHPTSPSLLEGTVYINKAEI